MKTYFITGITGFLGRNIVSYLLKKEPHASIVGFVLPNDKHRDIPGNITYIEGDILNSNDAHKFLSYETDNEKILIHAAGRISVYKRNDPLTMKINIDGTRLITDTAKELGFKKMLYVSSVDAISRRKGNEPIYEQDRYDENKVIGVYSKSKAISNNYVLDQADSDFEVVIVCPSAIMGPNDPFGAPINIAIKKAINNKLPAITKGGYDIVDVRDVAKGIIGLIEKGQNKESYILSGEYISVKDLMGLASEISGAKKVTFTIPHFLIKLVSPFIEFYARIRHKKPLFTGFSMDCLSQNSNYNHDKITSLTGYKPLSVKESLIDTIKWMKETNY